MWDGVRLPTSNLLGPRHASHASGLATHAILKAANWKLGNTPWRRTPWWAAALSDSRTVWDGARLPIYRSSAPGLPSFGLHSGRRGRVALALHFNGGHMSRPPTCGCRWAHAVQARVATSITPAASGRLEAGRIHPVAAGIRPAPFRLVPHARPLAPFAGDTSSSGRLTPSGDLALAAAHAHAEQGGHLIAGPHVDAVAPRLHWQGAALQLGIDSIHNPHARTLLLQDTVTPTKGLRKGAAAAAAHAALHNPFK